MGPGQGLSRRLGPFLGHGCVGSQRDYALKHLVTFILWAAAWLWFYWASLTGLVSVWKTEDYAYGWFLPFLAAGLGLERWRKCAGGGCDPSPVSGYICLGLTLGLGLLGRAGGLDSLNFWSLWLSIVTLVLLLCGAMSVWNQGLPLLILLFCLPAPLPLRLEIGRTSAMFSAELAARLLHAVGVPAFQAGELLDLGFMRLNVALECDGFRFMLPGMIVSLLLGIWVTRGLGRRLILVAAVPFLAVLANGLRLAAVGYLARHASIHSAQSFYHEASGSAVFGLMLAAILGLALILRMSSRAGAGDLERFGGPGRVCLLTPPLNRDCVLHVLVGAICLAASALSFPHIVSVKGQFTRETFATFPLALGTWEQDSEASAREPGVVWPADDTLLRVFVSADKQDRIGLRIAYRLVQRPAYHLQSGVTPPAGEGWTILDQGLLPPSESEGRDFPVAYRVFDREGKKILTYAWARGRGRVFVLDWTNRLALAWDTLLMRRADGALIRLDLPLRPGMSVAAGETVLNSFCREMKDILPGFIPEP